jgi:hypothetical protein
VSAALGLLGTCALAYGVEVLRTETDLTLANAHCGVKLDLGKGCGVLQITTAGQSQSLLRHAGSALYFAAGQQWVAEAWTKPSAVSVLDAEGGKLVQVDVDDFAGLRLRKTVRLTAGSPVIQIAYQLVALRDVNPQFLVPVGIDLSPALDRLISPGGAVPATDLKVDDFALQLEADWYAFASAATGQGLVVVPVSLPGMYRVSWIMHRADGSLGLAVRLHPEKALAAGSELRLAYNLVPFTGKPEEAVALARAAGAGPLSPPTPLAATLASGLRVVHCAKFAAAPVVDGKLEEGCWREPAGDEPPARQAGRLDRFMDLPGQQFAEAQTVARVGYDSEALYLGVRCDEPLMDRVRATAEPGSGRVWTDDCIEVFVDLRGDGKAYAHLIVNAAGVTQDNLPRERGVEYTWRAATYRGPDYWSAEVRVPLRDLGATTEPAAGQAWRLNLCRSRVTKPEASCWSPTLAPGNFHVPERFGVLVFGTPAVRIARLHTGLEGQRTTRVFSLVVDNPGPAVRLDGALVVAHDGKDLATAAATSPFEPGAEHDLALTYETPGPGAYRLGLSATVGIGGAKETVLEGTFSGTVHSLGLSSALFPPEEDDNRLYVAKKTVQHFFFVPANHGQKPYAKFDFVLTLPEGFEVINASAGGLDGYYQASLQRREPVSVDGERQVRWVWASSKSLPVREIKSVSFWSTWCGAIIPAARVKPGTYRYAFHLEAGEDREQEHTGQLIVLPEPRGRQPKKIVVGMSDWTIDPTPQFWTLLAETHRRCGINLVDAHVVSQGKQWTEPLRRRGMRSWGLLWWFWWNEAYLKAHPDQAAIRANGKPDPQMICPEVMAATDSDAIGGVMRGIVKNVEAGAYEGTWWDLEGPAPAEVCFCARCLAAFRGVAGMAAAEELTPLKIQARYGPQWLDFACGQSARVAARMQAYARHAGVPWKLGVYCGTQSESTRQSYRVDWRSLTPHLDMAAPSYYAFGPGDLGTTFVRGNLDFQKLIRGIKPIPVWNTLTTGFTRGEPFQVDGRVTRQQILKSVAYGADGTIQWWWGTNDGRHYQAYAEATTILAELEDFFIQGKMEAGFLGGDEAGGTTRVAWRRGKQVLVMLFHDGTKGALSATAQVPAGCKIARQDQPGGITLQGQALSVRLEPLSCRWVVLRPRT